MYDLLTRVNFRVYLICMFNNPLFYAVFDIFYYFLTWKTMKFLPAVPEYCPFISAAAVNSPLLSPQIRTVFLSSNFRTCHILCLML